MTRRWRSRAVAQYPSENQRDVHCGFRLCTCRRSSPPVHNTSWRKPRQMSGRLRRRQSGGRYRSPTPLLTFSGAKIIHPIRRGTRRSPEFAGESKHGHGASWRAGGSRRAFLALQPDQQLAGMRLVELPDLLNDHFDCAHAGSLARVRNEAIEFFGLNRPKPAPCLGNAGSSLPAATCSRTPSYLPQWRARSGIWSQCSVHHFFPSAFVPQRFTLMPSALAIAAFVSRHWSAAWALFA